MNVWHASFILLAAQDAGARISEARAELERALALVREARLALAAGDGGQVSARRALVESEARLAAARQRLRALQDEPGAGDG